MEVFLFIVGCYVQLAASSILLWKIYKQRSIYGLSIDTQIGFFIAVLVRSIWVMETRLVQTFFAYIELFFSLMVATSLMYACFKLQHTTQKHSTPLLRIYSTAPLAALMAFLFNPGDEWFSMQILVAFTMYIEALGLLPQLWLMRKMHEVEPLTSHFVGLLVCARFIRMVFWGQLFFLGEHFFQLFFADVLHTAFSADYMYLWCRKLKYGGRLVYSQGLSV